MKSTAQFVQHSQYRQMRSRKEKGKRRSTFRRHQTDFFHLQVIFFFLLYCMIKNIFMNDMDGKGERC